MMQSRVVALPSRACVQHSTADRSPTGLATAGSLGASFLGLRAGDRQAIPEFGPLAQLAEQRTFNPRVVGSIPTGPTLLTG